MFASCVAAGYTEVWTNYTLKIKNVRVKKIQDFSFLRKLKFSEEKRLIILDEG
jgi:hypothetical protein